MSTAKIDPSFDQFKHVLSTEEQQLMCHFYGHGTPKLTPSAIAEVMRSPGVSSMDVRRRVTDAIAKLRKARDKQT